MTILYAVYTFVGKYVLIRPELSRRKMAIDTGYVVDT
jgi:hypothetical protein